MTQTTHIAHYTVNELKVAKPQAADVLPVEREELEKLLRATIAQAAAIKRVLDGQAYRVVWVKK